MSLVYHSIYILDTVYTWHIVVHTLKLWYKHVYTKYIHLSYCTWSYILTIYKAIQCTYVDMPCTCHHVMSKKIPNWSSLSWFSIRKPYPAIWAHVMVCQAINPSKTLLSYNYCNIGTRGFIHYKLRYSLPISGGKLSCEKVDKHMKLVVVLLCRYAIICTNTYMTHFHRKAYHLRLEGYTIIQCVCTNYSLPVL